MRTATRVRRLAKATSANLANVLITNLAAQQRAAARHEKRLKEEAGQRAAAQRELAIMNKKAVQGAKNLVTLHKTDEVQEVLALMVKVRGHNFKLMLHDTSTSHHVAWMGWRDSTCMVYMTPNDVMMHVEQVGQADIMNCDFTSSLTNPTHSNGEYETDTTIEEEIVNMHSLYRGSPTWTVVSVKAIESFEGSELGPIPGLPYEWQRMSWFAFLIACADNEKLAKIMERAFAKVNAAK